MIAPRHDLCRCRIGCPRLADPQRRGLSKACYARLYRFGGAAAIDAVGSCFALEVDSPDTDEPASSEIPAFLRRIEEARAAKFREVDAILDARERADADAPRRIDGAFRRRQPAESTVRCTSCGGPNDSLKANGDRRGARCNKCDRRFHRNGACPAGCGYAREARETECPRCGAAWPVIAKKSGRPRGASSPSASETNGAKP